jgi:hypothetical protein
MRVSYLALILGSPQFLEQVTRVISPSLSSRANSRAAPPPVPTQEKVSTAYRRRKTSDSPGASTTPTQPRLAIETTQINPAECCFIDDRAPDLECAEKLVMRTIEMPTFEQLLEELRKPGVDQSSGIGQRPLA